MLVYIVMSYLVGLGYYMSAMSRYEKFHWGFFVGLLFSPLSMPINVGGEFYNLVHSRFIST